MLFAATTSLAGASREKELPPWPWNIPQTRQKRVPLPPLALILRQTSEHQSLSKTAPDYIFFQISLGLAERRERKGGHTPFSFWNLYCKCPSFPCPVITQKTQSHSSLLLHHSFTSSQERSDFYEGPIASRQKIDPGTPKLVIDMIAAGWMECRGNTKIIRFHKTNNKRAPPVLAYSRPKGVRGWTRTGTWRKKAVWTEPLNKRYASVEGSSQTAQVTLQEGRERKLTPWNHFLPTLLSVVSSFCWWSPSGSQSTAMQSSQGWIWRTDGHSRHIRKVLAYKAVDWVLENKCGVFKHLTGKLANCSLAHRNPVSPTCPSYMRKRTITLCQIV